MDNYKLSVPPHDSAPSSEIGLDQDHVDLVAVRQAAGHQVLRLRV